MSLVVAAAAVAGFIPSAAQSAGAEVTVQSTRDTLARWVETQQVISKEKRDWQLGKEVLEQRIQLLANEIDSLAERTGATRRGIEEADATRGELEAEKRALQQASSSLVGTAAVLERKTRELIAALPPPIRDRVAPLSQRIPSDSNDTELSLGVRFQNVIGVLNEVNKFNREITVATEVREMAGGGSAEVQTLYVGLGQAYFVTAAGDAAGFGFPTPEGWTWTEADELAPRIAQAIAILKNEQVPAYVPLPVELR
jgi:hypothetical protein